MSGDVFRGGDSTTRGALGVLAVLVCAMGFFAPLERAVALVGDPMTPAEVVKIDRDRDGTEVVVEGEAIGEDLRAIGGGRWVNILGGGVGLGIWMSDDMAAQIEHYGDYRHSGDVIRVVGTVNIACEQHGGEFDVHASSIEIISRGEPRPADVEPVKGVIGGAGLVMAFVLWRAYLKRRDRRME